MPNLCFTGRLVQGALNGGEGRFQLGAQALNDRDDGNRNPCGNEAVLDSRCARLVLRKTLAKLDQNCSLLLGPAAPRLVAKCRQQPTWRQRFAVVDDVDR